ncbi:Lrp/AsnC family transcriptional regulator [Saccharopolyspora sp. TS4A08]|uniref:Lrp/AsnC family transcriptional regulator n=1 Tax=Saccharopolyspora ipomoeae TaxID=3042027 RepID=A0ABT6PGG9_9PSEU|nr:Lrp/AsnC family transcriptional regulator [Saccharopolyspora sp. TS4A08]MDI2027024.1 Lrp/AsnC family transcriptional regulator [Saccharopolyspora sp. TS4A08]
MQDSSKVDETDLSLIHALQINPRVTWTRLGGVLDVDPSTLTRRWRRLTREGLAWFSCYPRRNPAWSGHGWQANAFVEVETVPGNRRAVTEDLAKLSNVWNIDATSGRRDLMLTVASAGVMELDEEVMTSIATVPGVRATRTHFFRRILREGGSWRLDALSPDQQRALKPASAQGRSRPGERDLALLRMLGPDARLPASEVARRLGCSTATASRWIERLLASDYVATRCEVAHYLAGWQVAATLWLDVPQRELTTVAAAIASLPEIRLCATIGSEANLVAQVWLHRLEDLDEFEEQLATDFSGTRVLDRWITPRFAKRMGHTLRADGRRKDFVPFFAECEAA